MGIIRKDFRYKLIKNFFTKEELKIGTHYFNLMHKRNDTNFDPMLHQSNNGDSVWSCAIDPFSDVILLAKKKLMEKELTSKTGKATMAYGGMSGGKKHMYVAGGNVTDNPGLKALRASGPKGMEAYKKITGSK